MHALERRANIQRAALLDEAREAVEGLNLRWEGVQERSGEDVHPCARVRASVVANGRQDADERRENRRTLDVGEGVYRSMVPIDQLWSAIYGWVWT